MRYLALACDYDATIAHHGKVGEETIRALERVRASGRKLLLVTGRELGDLISVFPRVDLFDRIVAENGALLYRPAAKDCKALGEPPPDAFVERLRRAGVTPLSSGRVIVATWEPHQGKVLELIREMGLDLQLIFNKGAVMVLPAGVNKATGLSAALGELALSPHNVVGVGDAENDHAFLRLCECAVAVANALPTLKQRADVVTNADHGAGVVELIDKLVEHDLREFEQALARYEILLGRQNGREIRIQPYGGGILVAGPSGSGKSTLAIGLLERLAECGYQFGLIDPEGDYEQVSDAVVLGDNLRPPGVTEIVQLLQHPNENALVKLYGLPLPERPAFFAGLLARTAALGDGRRGASPAACRLGSCLADCSPWPRWDAPGHRAPGECGAGRANLRRDCGGGRRRPWPNVSRVRPSARHSRSGRHRRSRARRSYRLVPPRRRRAATIQTGNGLDRTASSPPKICGR